MARGHARRDAELLERVLQRQGVDDRGEHAHVVGGGAVHAARAGRQAAEQIAAADDDGGLDAELLDFADLAGDLRGDRGIDPERLLAHEGFAGEFEEDAGVDGLDTERDYMRHVEATTDSYSELAGPLSRASASPTLNRTNRATPMFSPSLAIAAWSIWPTVSSGRGSTAGRPGTTCS